MRETDEQVKGQVLNRLASDGSGDYDFTNPASPGRSPTRYHAPELAVELVKLVNEQGDAAVPALRALATLELSDEQLRVIAAEVNPTRALSQTSANPNSGLDDRRRGIYLGSLRVLTTHSKRDPQFAGKIISEALKQKQPPGLSDAPAPIRSQIESKWKTYHADLAQALLAISSDIGPHLEEIVNLWVELNSPSHIQRSTPHERIISPCALGAAAPDRLAPIFAEHIQREESASPSVSTFLLVEALMGLACTKTQKSEHLQLVASVFNSHRDADEQITLNGKPFLQGLNSHRDAGEQITQHKSFLQEMDYKFWRATRMESVRSAAAATLIRLGVAGQPGMPSIRDALRDIDRNIDESSLPGAQQINQLPEEFRKELRATAVGLLNDPDEHLRGVAARVIADLWLAGNADGAAATSLRESARNHGDAEAFKSLLLIAHADNTSQSLKSELKELFKASLTQDQEAKPELKGLFKTSLTREQEAKRRGAVVALGSLYVKDESPRIRSNVPTYIPVPLDKDFAKELAPILLGVYRSVDAGGAKAEQQDVTDKKAEILKALGFLRAEVGTQILDIITSVDLQASRLQKDARTAAARSGPFQLPGICQLLEVSTKGAAIEAPMRAVAYYVSNNDETARLLISTLGPPPSADRRSQPAGETEERLWAILTTLKECKGSANLRDALGSRTVELVKKQGGKRNSALLLELAEKYQDTSFAAELIKAAGPVEPGISKWYYVLLFFGVMGFISLQIACARKPLRRFDWYNKIPEAKIPIPNYPVPLPLRPLARLVLRPFSKSALEAWVETCVSQARTEYELTCPKIDAWPNAVRINGVRLSRLETKKLRKVFSKTQVYTAIKGKNAQQRTNLACLLGWWAMAEQPGERLCEHLMLPVIIKAPSELLKEEEKEEQDLFLEEIKRRLWRLVMAEDRLHDELLLQLLKRRRVLIIIDGFEAGDQDLIGRFIARLDRYPVNARIITSTKNIVFDPPPKDIISIDA